jgi:iron complex outermembrane receptor protein
VDDCSEGVIAAVVAGIAAAVSMSFVHAAETPPTVGPPVVVTATRIDESASHYLIGARVITAQDIARSGASTLWELLRGSPDIRTRDLPGSPNPQIDLRGFGLFGEHNTLVLLDGIRVREYELLTVNWSAIPLSSIERIEILPAGSAVLHGGGATGGTINIITKAPARGSRTAEVGAEAASYDTWALRAGGSAAGENASVRLHGSHYDTEGYRDNQRVRIDNAQADVRWTGEAGSLSLKLGADDQYNGLPGVISEAQIAANRRQASAANNFSTQRGGYLNLGANAKMGSGDFTAHAGYRERDTSQVIVGTLFSNRVDTQVAIWTFAPRLQLRPEFGSWENTLVVGSAFEDWEFDGTSGPTIVGRPHSTQRTAAVYAQHAMAFASKTTVTLGAREQHARYDVTDRANPASSGAREHTLHAWDVSVRQAFSAALNVYGRGGSSFRVPNVSDNFNPTFARVTLLEPQTSRETELGVEGAPSTRWRYRATVYRFDLSNELFFDPVTLGSRNRQPTRRQGFALEGSWQATPSLGVHANYTYADATFREGTVGGISIVGNRVPISPRHTLNAGLAWAFSSRARADFDVHYTGTSAFDADEANTFGREIPAYTVADVKLTLRSGGWLFHAGVRNLFNEKYFAYGVFTGRPTYSAFPAEERAMFVSAQYAFH